MVHAFTGWGARFERVAFDVIKIRARTCHHAHCWIRGRAYVVCRCWLPAWVGKNL